MASKRDLNRRWASAKRADQLVRALRQSCLDALSVLFDDPQRYCQFIVDFDETNQGGSPDSLARALADADWVSDHALRTLTSLYQVGSSLVGEDAIALQRWATHRVVYHVDPTTLDAIEHTRWDTTVIPGLIFRRLPHPDPVVVLPEPLYIPHDSGNWERYDAFAVTASRIQDGRRVLCSTHHPDAVNIGLHYFARLVDALRERVWETRRGDADIEGEQHTLLEAL